MDQYSFIRLVNYIRSASVTAAEIMKVDMPKWEQDKFMMPVIEDDPLLMYGKNYHNTWSLKFRFIHFCYHRF